jgi:hypothetical protein
VTGSIVANLKAVSRNLLGRIEVEPENVVIIITGIASLADYH